MQRQAHTEKMIRELSQNAVVALNVKSSGGKKFCTRDYSAAILRKDPRCFVDGSGVLFLEGNCYLCAMYNHKTCWNDLRLRVVCGSVGFGVEKSRWFEFGNPQYRTVADFQAGHPALWDWHVWLEDDGGSVWDVLPAVWHEIAALHGQRLHMGHAHGTVLIKGKEKGELVRHGLEYIPAPETTQHLLLALAKRVYGPCLELLSL